MHPVPPSVTVIINPRAGARGGPDAATRRGAFARTFMTSQAVAADIQLTEGPGHARDLARAAVARGATLVCAWGGDGTVNEVASALAFQPAALGLVPSGSGNGLARAFGISSHPRDALGRALRGAERVIDVGEMGGRFFVNVAGIGLDARVAARFARTGTVRGPVPYVLHTATELLRSTPAEYDIRVGDEHLRRRAILVALANSREYGNGAVIAPRAAVDDGVLDLVLVEPMPVARLAAELPRLFLGTAERSTAVHTRAVTSLRISATEPILFHVDGEPVEGEREIEARVHPRALRVRA